MGLQELVLHCYILLKKSELRLNIWKYLESLIRKS